jgi:hypothetical protein
MARVTLLEVQAWGEPTKMGPALASITVEPYATLLAQVETQVLARVASSYTVTNWTNEASTPATIRTIIAMMYVSWIIDRQYSEDEDLNAYATRLAAQVELFLAGISDGSLEIPGVDNSLGSGQPSFYPNDESSSQCPTYDDPSLGGSRFSMGTVF